MEWMNDAPNRIYSKVTREDAQGGRHSHHLLRWFTRGSSWNAGLVEDWREVITAREVENIAQNCVYGRGLL